MQRWPLGYWLFWLTLAALVGLGCGENIQKNREVVDRAERQRNRKELERAEEIARTFLRSLAYDKSPQEQAALTTKDFQQRHAATKGMAQGWKDFRFGGAVGQLPWQSSILSINREEVDIRGPVYRGKFQRAGTFQLQVVKEMETEQWRVNHFSVHEDKRR